jgi:hypothetical protein
MAVMLADQEIERLIQEPKPLPAGYRSSMQMKPKRGHYEREIDVRGVNGSDFRLILRQSRINPLDFSVILGYRPPGSTTLFRLRRYNGKSHEHTNGIENQTFYEFHVHYATERYQTIGANEDSYAEPTDRYGDFQGAVSCLLKECAFEIPTDPQGRLFEEV